MARDIPLSIRFQSRMTEVEEYLKTHNDDEMRIAYDQMIAAYSLVKLSMIDKMAEIIRNSESEDRTLESYNRRVNRTLRCYIDLDKLFVNRTGNESLRLDYRQPEQVIKMITIWQDVKNNRL